MKKCGLDAYFFLRYLQTLLIIFIPMAVVIIPILIPLNYVGGINNDVEIVNDTKTQNIDEPHGLDTLAWGNVSKENTHRYWGHLILAVMVVVWVCGVFFSELKIFIKIRQDWLTTAEHRLRASATTVLVSAIPDKWLSEEALRGLFDVFPGGLRNVWLTRDFTQLLEKIKKRDEVNRQLEEAQTELIRLAKRNQLKKREADEKKERKQSKAKKLTKEERLQRQADEDTAAQVQAQSGNGESSGNQHEVPHNVQDGLDESREVQEGHGEEHHQSTETKPIMKLGQGFSKLTHGLGRGVGAVSKSGQGILGGAKHVVDQVDDGLETTNGFVALAPTEPRNRPNTRGSERHPRVQFPENDDPPRPSTQSSDHLKARTHSPTSATGLRPGHAYHGSVGSHDSVRPKESIELRSLNNTVRKMSNLEQMYDNEKVKWYEFWKVPAGGYASPVPQGFEDTEFPFKQKTLGQKLKSFIPFLGEEEIKPLEYGEAYNKDYSEEEEGAEWAKWVKKKHRPTHRLAKFEWTPNWLPTLPLINQKVDTIYWCRKELARLNVEIEADQKTPERFPLMRSAFVQFNHQVAAHMACQSVIHHVPRQMAPRTVEISPKDVIWDNMAISWWAEWLRTGVVFLLIAGMIILWAFPVTFTSSLSQISALIETVPWLQFLQNNELVFNVVKSLAGVIPAVLLALLLWLVPVIMDLLAGFKGAKTGSQKTESVQTFYFAFLFVQVFLVVTLTNNAFRTLSDLSKNPTSVTELLAKNLPKAANYFFSYMILQALSTSSGTLLQVGALANWYVVARIFNSTPRSKWTTNTRLPEPQWGRYFPVYTNFACIALVYSVIAPLISLFAIITFSLLWFANRYAMLYVNRLSIDTGGVLYPRAINQTFTGLYFMELCLIGLFFLVRDENDDLACVPHAAIMITVTILTGLYQILLNKAFGPMFRYLPITFEDEAVLRDEAFQRAQDRRLGLVGEDEEEEEESSIYDKEGVAPARRETSESAKKKTAEETTQDEDNFGLKFTLNPVKNLQQAGSIAMWGGKVVMDQTYGRAEKGYQKAAKYREQRRQKDLEAQRAIGDALYGGFHDEIEDLTPEERDLLVQRAFMHEALRARRPVVWIPRDDLGVSDDEIRRTREFSENIWITNEGTALDSKVRVVYGRAPPDFSELDLISL